MRKTLAAIALLFVSVLLQAQSASLTPNIGLQVPGANQANWQVPINYDLILLDKILGGQISTAALPAYRGVWASGTTYVKGIFVSYLGNLYASLVQNNVGNTPSSSPTDWVEFAGGGSSGVSSLNTLSGDVLIDSPDDSVAVTRSGQTIHLETAGGGGVPFNPSTTKYIVASFSGLYDDNHSLSSAVPVDTWGCDGTTNCTVHTTSAHGYAIGDYVDVHTLTGWPNSGTQEPFLGSFQIIATGFTTTAFEFAFVSSATCSSSCGNVYNANYWAIYQTANMPFLKGHGTVYGFEEPISGLDSDWSTTAGPLCSSGAGPNFLILQIGQNDLSSGETAQTMEPHFLSVYAKAHADGCIVMQGSIAAANYGGFADPSIWANIGVLNQFFPQQVQSATNEASGQYIDQYVDYAAYLSYSGVQLGGDSAGAYIFAQRTNEAIGTKAGNAPGPYPSIFQWGGGIGINISDYFSSKALGWFDLSDNSHNPCPSPGNSWQCSPVMYLQGPHLHLINGSGSTDPQLEMLDNQQSSYVNMAWGYDEGNLNRAALGFHRDGDHSPNNWAGISLFGLSDFQFKLWGDGHAQFPLMTGTGSSGVQVDATGNVIRDGLWSAAGTPAPTCNSGSIYQAGIVTDATAPTYLGTYTSGGAVTAGVFCDGTNWITN